MAGFQFNPPTGLLDTTKYPDVPASPTAARQQFMDLFNQVGDEITAQKADIAQRGINVLYPPTPLVACKGDGSDETTLFNAIYNLALSTGKTLIIPETSSSYKLSKFNGLDGVNVVGIGKPKIDLYNKIGESVVPLLSFGNDAVYENLYFNCLEVDLVWNRGELTNRSNVVIRNCRIEGFRNPTNMNAWGLYLQNSKNIMIENCHFENNSQSDIAIVEGCENITILNPRGSNLHINFEPNNGSAPISNVKISGGTIKTLSLLENDYKVYSNRNLLIENATIENATYDGANVKFVNCVIKNVSSGWGGSVDFGGAILFKENLIKDSQINVINTTDSEWKNEFTTTSPGVRREFIASVGNVLVLNPMQYDAYVTISSRNAIPIEATKKYAISFTGRGIYAAGSGWIGQQIKYYCRDAGGVTVYTGVCAFARGNTSSTTDIKTEICILNIPAETTSIIIKISNSNGSDNSTSRFEVAQIGLHEIEFSKSIDQLDFTSRINIFNKEAKTYVTAPPTDVPAGYVNIALAGMKLYNVNPTAGSYEGWVCIASGNPGTWKGFGLIEA